MQDRRKEAWPPREQHPRGGQHVEDSSSATTLSLSGAYGVSCRARAERAALRHQSGDSPLEPDRLLWGPPLPRHVVSGLGWVLIAGKGIRTRCRTRSWCSSCNARACHAAAAQSRGVIGLGDMSTVATPPGPTRPWRRSDLFDMLPRAESSDSGFEDRGTQFFGASLAVVRERRSVTSASPSANPVGNRIAARPRPRRFVYAFTICSFLVRAMCNHGVRS